jgi:DNA (cytosine-5)-methyltransferase 1
MASSLDIETLQKMKTVPIAVDLFAGAGGLSLGFQQAGFAVLAAVEHDPIHCATHDFNFPQCAVICRSVADIDGDYIRSHSEVGDAEIAVVVGGAPCQGFSLIGKRALDDPRNALPREFVRLVDELRPRYFVFENVRGLTIGRHRSLLQEIIDSLREIGYSVREPYRVLNALRFGVPQSRERLFLLGARKGLRLPRYPSSTHEPDHSEQGLFSLPSTPTVWDAIGDLPEADSCDELLERDWAYLRFGIPSEYAKQLRKGGPSQNGLRLLASSLRTVHTSRSIKRFTQTRPGRVEEISRFLKLDPDGYCNTLRSGTASDRGAFTSPRPIHPHTPRCITVREAARLHSYPDWFRFHATKWHGFRQIGNSVPPLLAQAVAREIAAEIGGSFIVSSEPPQLGDENLLTMDMSQAAARYGVASDVIPKRKRSDDVAYA